MSILKRIEKYKRACAVIILHDGGDRIILGYSKKHKDWELPGGKHEYGETSEQCAMRECLEECQIGVHDGLEFVCITETERNLCVNYSKRISGHWMPHPGEPEKHSKWAWFLIDDLPDNIRSECEKVLEIWRVKRLAAMSPARAGAERSGNTAIG